MERVLIVGDGYAGSRAAGILAGTGRFEVLHVSDEPHPAYCRHLLPEVAAGERSPEDLYLPGEVDCGTACSVRTGVNVATLSPRTMTAAFPNGEEVRFDKAVIATGARVFVPGTLRGLFGRCGNVVSMRRMEEALALRRLRERRGPRVAVIGAGRIGVLLAEALKRVGARISIVDIAHEILPTMLQPDVAAKLRPHLLSGGDVSCHLGRTVERVAMNGENAEALHLSDGTLLPCDFVVLATGVVPNTEFLDAGSEIDAEGIPVNARMETRFPGIYAAGDVIRFETMNGKTEPGQLIVNARQQAEVAARNIAGESVSCPPLFVGNVTKVGSIVGAVAGDVAGSGHEDFRVGESFLRVTMEGTGISGFQFVGPPDDLRGLVPGVLKRVDAGWLRQALRGSTGLGLVPPVLAEARAWA